MSLIINAFYSNKEIFLRELISNASDAMDKIQYQAAQDPGKLAVQPEMYIKVTPDKQARTIVVEDTGIGMTREEMINNLGTIAKSGTKAFMEAVSAGVDMSMIGQFGVGFYSSYLVSEKVRVVSKSNDDEQYVWESAAGGTFLVWKDETFDHGTLKRGTKVICYLKDEMSEFLESDRLKDLIMKHSAFVGFPIELYMEHCREESLPDSEEKKMVTSHAWELINKNKPVWLRAAETVTHQEYADVYRFLAGDWEDHLAVKHVLQGGQVDFKALLYCPRSAPKDMFDMGKMSQRFNIRLYVRRVFIKEFNDLIPKWMGFIKGIVDSDDMPLNISREQLQQNAILKHIKTGLQKNAFAMFCELAKDKEKYKAFHDSFAQCLKLGIYEDHANREQIIPLLRYYSSKSGENLVSLDQYIDRMKPGQRHILHITGRSRRDAARSPYIEGLRRDGYEILYMTDPVDEYAVQFLKEYRGKELMSCMNINAVSLLDHRTAEDVKAELEPVRARVEAALVPRVQCVVLKDGMPADCFGRVVSDSLELNLKHSLLKEFAKRTENDADTLSITDSLYEISLLHESDVDDPRRTSACEKIQELIQRLNAGEQDGGSDDLPVFDDSAPATNLGIELTSARQSKDEAALFSCGSAVRVVKGDIARRAIVSFVDEAAGTVDVMYPVRGGAGEEEEEGVPMKAVQKLFDFETKEVEPPNFGAEFFKAASDVKEQGNRLFKVKDYEAAGERYTRALEAFKARPPSRGQQVLSIGETGEGKATLASATVTSSADADGVLELSDGTEVAASQVLPVIQELLPLHTSLYMNRARCRQNLGLHQGAAQDLTVVLGLWRSADKRMLEADMEMREAEAKGICTAEYLRARSRLARGLVKQAASDVRSALARNPPAATAKQLRQLKEEIQVALEKHKQVNGPLSKELAKVIISLRGGPKIS